MQKIRFRTLLFGTLAIFCTMAQGRAETVQIRVFGGLGGVNQYVGLEEPFWRKEIGPLTGGRIVATIAPFDSSGMRAQDMLQLIRLGVAPFGTVLLSVAESEDPELNAVDLAGINPDFATLREHVSAYRDHLRSILSERYGVRLLAIYAYPAQVLYCAKPFAGLDDLQGRTIRTSSVTQSDLFDALGAKPVVIPFADTVSAVRKGVADCAVTGTLSGNENGLAAITSHLSPMAINWGLSIFAANEATWQALPEDVRRATEAGLSKLEAKIWESARTDTAAGIDCNTGQAACPPGSRRAMNLVPLSRQDEDRRASILATTVLPRWVARCGEPCANVWRATGDGVPGGPVLTAGQTVRP